MDEKDRKFLKAEIKKSIEKVSKDIESYKELSIPVSPDNAIGRISRMEAINSKSINEAALKRAEDELHSLKKALKNINNPDYGLCMVCEEPIPLGRLKILPGAELCVSCAPNNS